MNPLYRAVWWKELRQLGPIFAVILALAVGLVVVAEVTFGSPGTSRKGDLLMDVNGTVVLGTALLFALVSGGMCLAGDREDQTQPWLDTVVDRRPLWNAKVSFGLLANLLFSAAVIVIYLAAMSWPQRGDFSSRWDLSRLFFEATWPFLIVSLLVYLWGVAFSAWARTTLIACSLAIVVGLSVSALAGVASVPLYAVLLSPLWVNREPWPLLQWIHGWILAGTVACPAVAAVLLGRASFVRLFDDRDPVRALSRGRQLQTQMLRVAWLTLRQARWKAAGLGALLALWWFGLLVLARAQMAGLAQTVEADFSLFLVRHKVALCLGAVCGVFAFSDEQADDTRRFWGQQGLSLGALWLTRIGSWFALALLLWTINSAAELFIEGLFPKVLYRTLDQVQLGQPGLEPLRTFSEVLTALCVGQLVCLWFRKSVVSLLATVLIAAPLTLLWYPSQVSGWSFGLMHETQWGVLAILLAGGYGLRRAWTTDRLFTRRPVLWTAAVAVAVLAWDAASLYRRATPVPLLDLPPELTQPPRPMLPADEVGQRVQLAARELGTIVDQGGSPLHLFLKNPSREESTGVVDAAAADPRLPKLYSEPWLADLESIADETEGGPLPGVMLDDVRYRSYEPQPERLRVGALVRLFAIRAMQLSASDDPDGALTALRNCLALTQMIRHRGLYWDWLWAGECDRVVVYALSKCMHQIGPNKPWLRAALADWTLYEAALDDPNEAVLDTIRHWLANGDQMAPPDRFAVEYAPQIQLLRQIINVPWEIERRKRLRRLAAVRGLQILRNEYDQIHSVDEKIGTVRSAAFTTPPSPELAAAVGSVKDFGQRYNELLWSTRWPEFIYGGVPGTVENMAEGTVNMRAALAWRLQSARLMLALAIYRTEHGQSAETAADLVPGTLEAIPIDPYSPTQQPLQWMTAKSELFIKSSAAEPGAGTIHLAPGQQMILSVGTDMAPLTQTGLLQKSGSSAMSPIHIDLLEASQTGFQTEMWYQRPADFALVVPRW